MKKIVMLASVAAITLTSCVSQKKYSDLEAQHKETQDLLNTATVKLNSCLEERASLSARAESLKEQNDILRANNQELINNMGNLTTLTQKGAENLEKSLESLREKDLTIRRLQDAVTRRDSVNLALVQSLKGVVYVSISDKLLFSSGSYTVTNKAKEVLGKVATVVKNKPDFEFMVEGHTDNVPIRTASIKDNWDLSVLRATAVVRILQDDFKVDPKRMTAAGRSQYVPVVGNDTAQERAKNRRTRIVVLPKIDQFYTMIEEGMKDPKIN